MLFRVLDRWTGRICALKTSSDAAGEAALTQEFRLLGSLRHPCVLRSLDLVRDEEGLGHLVEFVPAIAPARLWDAGREPAVRAALVQALRGLSYLHRHGWVHGDVAPGNILVWPEGETWRAKVADFGFAAEAADAARAGVRGTPGYMAPEVARGEGLGRASDCFGLAATAVCWIDGRGPWDDLRPEETLRAAAKLAAPLAPRRTVGPELRRLIELLGQPRAADRRPPPWKDLREDAVSFGPPVLEPGVFGLHAAMKLAVGEAELLAAGVALVYAVQGRAGSGRRTFALGLARELTARGWAALVDVPLAALRDWLESGASDPDPVRLARRLTERFAGRDLVIVWPENLPEFEVRLFQAFTAARGGPDVAERTIILRLAPADAEAPVDAWLRGARRVTDLPWELPVEAGLDSVVDDLFSEEEGYGEGRRRRPRPRAGETPLSLILRKRAALEGREAPAVTEGVDAVAAEVSALWRRLDGPLHEALALIAASSAGWTDASLAALFGWDPREAAERMATLAGLTLLRGDYEGGARRLRPGDWMVREALIRHARAEFTPERIAAVGARLEGAPELHPGDLPLALAFAEGAVVLPRYALGALDRALAAGRFDAVLRFRDVVETIHRRRGALPTGAPDPGRADAPAREEFLARYLRAAKRLGRFAVEEEILKERLLAVAGTPAEYEVRVDLAKTLFALGRWQEAVAECEAMQSAPEITDEQRLWAELQRAEVLWQVGRFGEAEAVYELAESRIADDDRMNWKKLALGRARERAQRGDMAGGLENLTLAIRRAGNDECMSDPLFLSTSGGLHRESGSGSEAAELCRRAVALAETRDEWQTYVMASARLAGLEITQGSFASALREADTASATSLALGSQRMAASAGCYAGHAAYERGLVTDALRRGTWATDLGGRMGDRVLAESGFRVRMMAAARFGLASEFERCSRLVSAGEINDNGAIVLQCSAILAWVKSDDAAAVGLMKNAIEVLVSKDSLDVVRECRLRLVEEVARSDGDGSALKLVAEIESEANSLGHGRLVPLCQALEALYTSGSDTASRLARVRDSIETMRIRGQIADLCFWSAPILARLVLQKQGDLTTEVARSLLSAFQIAARGLEDDEMRKQFLSANRFQQALKDIKGLAH